MSVYEWVSSHKNAVIPPKAVESGTDLDGSKVFVGRAKHQGDELPCKVIPRRKQAYVSYNGREVEVTNFEVMVEKKLAWINNSGARIPPGAISGGRTAQGETLYIGRARHAGVYCVGKVHPSHGCLYIPFGGIEHSYRDYEILVVQ